MYVVIYIKSYIKILFFLMLYANSWKKLIEMKKNNASYFSFNSNYYLVDLLSCRTRVIEHI